MADLIHLAIPALLLLMAIEALRDALMRRDLYELQTRRPASAWGWAMSRSTWVWLLLLFGDEFSYYWFPRASHECRLFWASHGVHHSSQRYNLSTALRQSWTGTFLGWIFWMWLPWVGFHPVMVLTMQAVSLLHQFWIHTELVGSFGPFELVLNTPSHHRVHHGSNPAYIDGNHAGTLIIWDRRFGTFEPEDRAELPRFGLTKNIHTYNPVGIAFHEWAGLCGAMCARLRAGATSWAISSGAPARD